MEDIETYVAWKESWVSRHGSLDNAIDVAREQGGEDYAARVERIILEMEAHLSGPA